VGESVLIIDPAQKQIVAAIPTGSPYSHMMAVMPDLSRAYVSDVQSKFVSVLDLPGRKLADKVPTQTENQRMTLSPDLKWFVTNLGPAHKVAFFRTSDNAHDFDIDVDGSPFVARFSPDGKYLYDAGHNQGKAIAWKIDMEQRKPVASLVVGQNVGSLAVDPEGDRVYVSDQAKDWVTEIDPEAWKISKRLNTQRGPDQIVFATVQ
jgi:DNA-binding beta-propeller fold protein YncE